MVDAHASATKERVLSILECTLFINRYRWANSLYFFTK